MHVCLILCCCLFVLVTHAYPQEKEYPRRPIEIIAPTPGSLGDLWVRAWIDQFSKILKVPVIVVNKGGALSQWIQLSMAKPDGYSIAFFSYPSLVAYAISSNPPFDMFKDFAAIGALGASSTVLAVEKSSPFATFDDLIDYAKKNPKKLKCGTPGIHLHDHFAVELIKEHTGADIVMVPFKGASQLVTALLGKHVDLASVGPAPLMGLIQPGRVRLLLTVMRLKEFPDVPLFSEKGVGEAGIVNWTGIFAPSAAPKEVQKKLIDAFEKVSKDPKALANLDKLGFTSDYMNPTALTTQIKKDYEKIKAVVKRVGISE